MVYKRKVGKNQSRTVKEEEKVKWFDLHRHDEYSSFDGFGKAVELAKLAKQYGYPALGISNHGNTNGLIQHYMACKSVGIKPVLGVEGYMLPKYKEKHRGYHLCLFAKNLKGYHNINAIQFEGDKQKYYNPIWTFDLLEKYSEGVICTSACIAGFLSQAIKNRKYEAAKKFIKKMVKIYGDDFYIEVQPYKISEPGLQEAVDRKLIELADEFNVPVIFTSDSHYGSKEDFPTYLKMHEIAGHDLKHIEQTYKERYMPTQQEIGKRALRMFPELGKAGVLKIMHNHDILYDSIEEDFLAALQQTLPPMQKELGVTVRELVKKGLKEKGKWNKEYRARVEEELEVIETLGFDDYFLMVYDYVNWAKSHGIAVGPGRGSCCNCEVAYALGITEVDSLYHGLDFRRFLRIDKKKMPDIDLDFEKSRRAEVINYIINRHKGHTARIASYGLYKVDNLVNDLAKVCGLPTTKGSEDAKEHAEVIAEIKEHIKHYIDEEGNLETSAFIKAQKTRKFNALYDNICLHFTKLYKKMRFIGTHAAGVAITGGNILDYTSLRLDKEGELYTVYDLNDIENIGVIKFDILGLVTMEELGALRKVTGDTVDYEEAVNDKKLMREFSKGNTIGIFQFDKPAVQALLERIKCSCFEDIVAANAINRPGPLSTGIPDLYAYNKEHPKEARKSLYYPFTKDTFGTIVYQEQIQKTCVEIAGMTWGDADKVMKMIGGQSQSEDAKIQFEKDKKELGDKFVKGAMEKGISKDKAKDLFNSMLVYSFNKGHALGYSLISVEEMYYKVYHPTEFWWAKLKYCPVESNIFQLEAQAVAQGNLIFLPHVNGSDKYSLKEIEGEYVIQRGLTSIKGVGEKVAKAIAENGPYESTWDMEEKIPKRLLTSRVVALLKEAGALEWNEEKYLERCTKLNASLYSKSYSRL